MSDWCRAVVVGVQWCFRSAHVPPVTRRPHPSTVTATEKVTRVTETETVTATESPTEAPTESPEETQVTRERSPSVPGKRVGGQDAQCRVYESASGAGQDPGSRVFYRAVKMRAARGVCRSSTGN